MLYYSFIYKKRLSMINKNFFVQKSSEKPIYYTFLVIRIGQFFQIELKKETHDRLRQILKKYAFFT